MWYGSWSGLGMGFHMFLGMKFDMGLNIGKALQIEAENQEIHKNRNLISNYNDEINFPPKT